MTQTQFRQKIAENSDGSYGQEGEQHSNSSVIVLELKKQKTLIHRGNIVGNISPMSCCTMFLSLASHCYPVLYWRKCLVHLNHPLLPPSTDTLHNRTQDCSIRCLASSIAVRRGQGDQGTLQRISEENGHHKSFLETNSMCWCVSSCALQSSWMKIVTHRICFSRVFSFLVFPSVSEVLPRS